VPAAGKAIGCGKFFTELKLATPSLPLHQNAADPLFLFGIDKTSLGVGLRREEPPAIGPWDLALEISSISYQPPLDLIVGALILWFPDQKINHVLHIALS
jgi:hypothetical protein